MFAVVFIAPHATMVICGNLFDGMHPEKLKGCVDHSSVKD